MKQLEERLKGLISDKTRFNKESIELGNMDVKVNFQYPHIEAYFLAGNEEYVFSYNEAWETGYLMKVIQTWG